MYVLIFIVVHLYVNLFVIWSFPFHLYAVRIFSLFIVCLYLSFLWALTITWYFLLDLSWFFRNFIAYFSHQPYVTSSIFLLDYKAQVMTLFNVDIISLLIKIFISIIMSSHWDNLFACHWIMQSIGLFRCF